MAIWYTHVTYPLLWNEYWRIWPSYGCLGSEKRRRPSGRLWSCGSLDPASNLPAISTLLVKGLFGTHMLHSLCCGINIDVSGQVWVCLGSQKRMRPSGRLWFYGSLDPPPYVPAISSPWVKGLFDTHMLHTLCCGMNIGVYGQVWGALVPRNEGVPLAEGDFKALWTLHTMYNETKAFLWQIVILWQSGPCTLCSSNIGSLGQRAIWYTHVTYPLFWNECWRIWPSLVCLGSQKRRRPSGRLWFCGSLDPASNLPAISTLWVKGLFGTLMLHTLCCGMNIGVYGQVWGALARDALVTRNEDVPLADCDFIVFRTLHPMYQQHRLPGS